MIAESKKDASNLIFSDISDDGEGVSMVLENKLNLTNQVELAQAEEKISKQKAKQFF